MSLALAPARRYRPQPVDAWHSADAWDWEPHGTVARSIAFSDAGWGEVERRPVSVVRADNGLTYEQLKARILEMENWSLPGKPNVAALAIALYALQASHSMGILPSLVNPTGDESLLLEYVFDDGVHALDIYNSGEIVYVCRRNGMRTVGSEIAVQDLDETIRAISRYAYFPM